MYPSRGQPSAQPSQPAEPSAGNAYPTIGAPSPGFRVPPSTSAAMPSAQTLPLPNGVAAPAGGLKPVLRVKIAEPYRVHPPVRIIP